MSLGATGRFEYPPSVRTRFASVVSLSVLVVACGGRAIWDPEYHSNRHPADASGGAGGDEVTSDSGPGVTSVTTVGVSSTGVTTGATTGVTTATASVTTSGAGGEMTATVAGSGGANVASSSATTGSGGQGGGPLSTAFEEVALGTKNINEPFTFDVPPNTLGFTVVVKSSVPKGMIGVKQLQSPAMETVVNNHKVKPGGWELVWYGLSAAGVPQSDAMSAMPVVLPGPWTATLGDPFTGVKSGSVSVWLRTSSDGEFHGGSVDVNVFRTSNAASVAYLDNVLAKAFNSWAGMKLGNVAHYALDNAYANVDEQNFLAVVEESGASKNIPALNVFVIEAFVGNLKDALGIAAGIPGVGIAPGSTASGVVIMPTSDPELDAEVLKHESGHLSGLFHTTEINGSATDPLGDTVSCASVQQQGLGCPDSVNIMFPFANATATELSPMQLKVIRGATLYRGAFDSVGMGNIESPPKAVTPAPSAFSTISLATGAWRRHVPPSVAELLASHWCHDGAHVDHPAVVSGFASKAEFEALAHDPAAPVWLRERARRAALAHR